MRNLAVFLLAFLAAVVVGRLVQVWLDPVVACAGDTAYMIEIGDDPTPPEVHPACVEVLP